MKSSPVHTKKTHTDHDNTLAQPDQAVSAQTDKIKPQYAQPSTFAPLRSEQASQTTSPHTVTSRQRQPLAVDAKTVQELHSLLDQLSIEGLHTAPIQTAYPVPCTDTCTDQCTIGQCALYEKKA